MQKEKRQNNIPYTVRRSKRAKYMNLAVHGDGRVVVTIPYGVGVATVERFVEEKKQWVIKHVEAFQQNKALRPKKHTRAEYLLYKERARKHISEKIAYFNKHSHFSFKSISVRNQKTRWGSCSSKGNLNFNYRILFLPDKLVDYLIVHELCHLKEMNHSKRFWTLVASILPDYKERQKGLKKYNHLYQ